MKRHSGFCRLFYFFISFPCGSRRCFWLHYRPESRFGCCSGRFGRSGGTGFTLSFLHLELLQQFPFFLSFFRCKIAIGINHFPDVEFAVVESLGHRKAFCRANRGTQSAIATFCHIDIELRSIQPDNRSVGGPAYFFRSFDRLDIYTIYRTNFGAFIAYDAVFDLVVKAITAVVGDRNGFLRVLYSHHACLYLEKVI